MISISNLTSSTLSITIVERFERVVLKSVLKPVSKLPWCSYTPPFLADIASVVQNSSIVDKTQGPLPPKNFTNVDRNLVFVDGVWAWVVNSDFELPSSLERDVRLETWAFSSSCVKAEYSRPIDGYISSAKLAIVFGDMLKRVSRI